MFFCFTIKRCLLETLCRDVLNSNFTFFQVVYYMQSMCLDI